MCGITGFVDFNKKTNLKVLEEASLKLAHRGTDGNGTFFEELPHYNLGLASRRLAIIDISDKGLQPFISDCQNFLLVFNGTIYNFKELSFELKQLGYKFYSNSDTEVLLACYIKWGTSFFKKINGIYAFCIYDKTKNILALARDNIGVKPLYYSYNQDLFSFASEINGIKPYSKNREINKKSLAYFLKNGYFPKNASIYQNINKVKPGEFLEINLDSKKLETKNFWKLPVVENVVKQFNEQDTINECHKLLKQSILSRTVADTEIGVLLSGGIDSSITAAIVQQNSNKAINTFTIGFEDKEIDESANARRIAQHLKTNHHEHILTKHEAIKTIKDIGKIYDEPMGDSGAIALFAATKLASEQVKVLLSSEGGDELFAGYNSYSFCLKWFPKFKLLPKLHIFNFIHPKVESLLASKSILEFYTNINAYFTDEEVNALLKSDELEKVKQNASDNLNILLSYDLENYLPEDLLMKADRTFMFWGIENRDALLNISLVSYASNISEKLKLKHKDKKHILKEIAYQYLPKKLLNQPKKGFSIPIESWLKTDLKDFVITELKDSSIYNLVDKEEVNKTLKKFLKNKRGYYRKIWILLSLKLWANEHLSK